MSEVTAVPIRPLARGSMLKLWLALIVLIAAAVGIAWVGTNAMQVTTTKSGLRYQIVEEGTGADRPAARSRPAPLYWPRQRPGLR